MTDDGDCLQGVALANLVVSRVVSWRHLDGTGSKLALDCLVDEREYYHGLGWTGPIYMRESYAQQSVLMTRIRALEGLL